MRYDVNDMINRFTTLWGDPKTDNIDVYLHEYHRALDGTDPDLLEAATDACIDTETYWPRVAVVKRHVDIASSKRPSRYKPAEHQPIAGPPPSPEMKARVAALLAKGKAVLQAMQDPPDAKPNYWRDVTKPAFEEMQRNSPNPHLHQIRNPAGRDA